MAAVTICSDFGAQEDKVCHCFHYFPSCFPWSDGTRCPVLYISTCLLLFGLFIYFVCMFFYILHVSKIIQCLSFFIWLSINIIPLRPLHVVARVKIFFSYDWVVFCFVCVSACICLCLSACIPSSSSMKWLSLKDWHKISASLELILNRIVFQEWRLKKDIFPDKLKVREFIYSVCLL